MDATAVDQKAVEAKAGEAKVVVAKKAPLAVSGCPAVSAVTETNVAREVVATIAVAGDETAVSAPSHGANGPNGQIAAKLSRRGKNQFAVSVCREESGASHEANDCPVENAVSAGNEASEVNAVVVPAAPRLSASRPHAHRGVSGTSRNRSLADRVDATWNSTRTMKTSITPSRNRRIYGWARKKPTLRSAAARREAILKNRVVADVDEVGGVAVAKKGTLVSLVQQSVRAEIVLGANVHLGPSEVREASGAEADAASSAMNASTMSRSAMNSIMKRSTMTFGTKWTKSLKHPVVRRPAKEKKESAEAVVADDEVVDAAIAKSHQRAKVAHRPVKQRPLVAVHADEFATKKMETKSTCTTREMTTAPAMHTRRSQPGTTPLAR